MTYKKGQHPTATAQKWRFGVSNKLVVLSKFLVKNNEVLQTITLHKNHNALLNI